MANRYANLVGSNKIKDEYTKINQGFDLVEQDIDKLQDEVEYIDDRVDQIISDPTPGKDPELVDIRTVDSSYTPERPISVAGDVTRDMQAQLSQLVSDATDAQGIFNKYLAGTNSRGMTGWSTGADNISKAGLYYVRTNQDGLPVSEDGYLLHMMDTNTSSITAGMQLYTPYGQNRIFFRRRDAQQWLAWVELMTGYRGTGSPEGAVTAIPGMLYQRTDTGELWVKLTGFGNTGWGKVLTS